MNIPIFDIHCHPGMKVYLCDADLTIAHTPRPDSNRRSVHVDLPGMKQGNVQLILSFQYVPEHGLGRMANTGLLFRLLHDVLHVDTALRFEDGTDGEDCTDKAMDGIRRTTRQIGNAPAEFNAVVPLDAASFLAAIKSGKTILLHGLEGSHHLGRNLDDVQNYLRNLERFQAAGVRILTLAHFFQNSICGSGGGIPPSEADLFGYRQLPEAGNGLTAAGALVVSWCQDNGMIIDLVHSTIATREQVYAILNQRIVAGKKITPVVFSHTGVREAAFHLTRPGDIDILPNADEIRMIARYGGCLGMILMNYWQIGDEDGQGGILVHDAGIRYVIEAMKWIKAITLKVDNIAIGTDLDGFTQVPTDVQHVKFIDNLRQAMLQEFSPEEVHQICWGNALRILGDSFDLDNRELTKAMKDRLGLPTENN